MDKKLKDSISIKTKGDYGQLQTLVEYISIEGWEYDIHSEGPDTTGVTLKLPFADGVLFLSANGSWEYRT